jgi:PKD repeat protein
MNAYDDSHNYWNNNYPFGGNYWDDYTGEDYYRGSNQDQPGSDDIGDTPYNISGDGDNKDYYPLMYEWGENPPVADFSFKVNNFTVFFNASSSCDRDGYIISYDWDFGDNTSGTGMLTDHTYDFNGTYNVTLNVTDNDGNYDDWSQYVRIGNQAPNAPSNPNPSNGVKGVDINADLSWNCSDPDGDSLTYDVYFEADDPTPDVLVSNNQSENSFDPGTMDLDTIYYWEIVSWDSWGALTSGPIWNFTTETNDPPYVPSDPSPKDGSTDVDVDVDLSWSGGDPNENDTVVYDVFLEADIPDPKNKIADDIGETWFDPGTLNYNTTYYWRIMAKDNHFYAIMSPVWHFTTEVNMPPSMPNINGPAGGKIGMNYEYTFKSVDPEGHDIYYFVDWGDGTVEQDGWIGPYASGLKVTIGHIWSKRGTYLIKVKAEDTVGAESGWSEFEVEIPRNRAAYNSLVLRFLVRFPMFSRFFYLIR